MRPFLDIPPSAIEIVLNLLAAIGVLFCVLTVVQSWSNLPDSIPSHFGPSGAADAWGSKWTLLIVPVLVSILFLALTILSRYPHLYNYAWPITEQNAEQQYRLARLLITWLKLEVIGVFSYIEWKIIQVALGRADGLGTMFLPVSVLLIFGTIGLYLWQAYLAR